MSGRAIELADGRVGTLTIGGTVSPAGGNFEEPVTQGTLKVVGAFHGLSAPAATPDAIRPLIRLIPGASTTASSSQNRLLGSVNCCVKGVTSSR